MNRYWILHPFIFAVYPIIALLAANLGGASPEHIIRPIIVAELFTLLALIVARLLSKSWHKAAFLVSLFLVFFQSYGHIYHGATDYMPDWFTQIQRFVIPVLWLILLGIGVWFIWRAKQPHEATMYLNIIALAMIALPAFNAAYYYITTSNDTITADSERDIVDVADEGMPSPFLPITIPPQTDVSNPPPDIYYILLDAYGRSDTLQELYDYDNTEFIGFLENKGFYVADKSITNYTRTLFVLSAMFNGGYLDDVAARLGPESNNLMPVERLVKQNRVVDALQENGYRIITISTGYERTSLSNSDVYLRYDVGGRTEFEDILLMNTPLGPLLNGRISKLSIYEIHRARVLYAFEQLRRMPEEPGPKFVFVHIVAPHPPYVFGPDGEDLDIQGDPLRHDGLPPDVHIPAYRGNTAYISTLAQEAIEQILAESETPPVILMHGDHGPWMRFGSTPEETCLKERYTILNSFYFPDGDYEQLYPGISPVNTFRVVMDKYFGTDLGLLEDKTYYSGWTNLYDFVDVTDRVETCTWSEE